MAIPKSVEILAVAGDETVANIAWFLALDGLEGMADKRTISDEIQAAVSSHDMRSQDTENISIIRSALFDLLSGDGSSEIEGAFLDASARAEMPKLSSGVEFLIACSAVSIVILALKLKRIGPDGAVEFYKLNLTDLKLDKILTGLGD